MSNFLINKKNNSRCSTNPFCPSLEKIKGIYHCIKNNEDVDGGDEEDGSDYIFTRTKSCLTEENIALKKQLELKDKQIEVLKECLGRLQKYLAFNGDVWVQVEATMALEQFNKMGRNE